MTPRPEGRPGTSPNRRLRRHGITPIGDVRASIHVCEAAGCLALNSEKVVEALVEKLDEDGVYDVAVNASAASACAPVARWLGSRRPANTWSGSPPTTCSRRWRRWRWWTRRTRSR